MAGSIVLAAILILPTLATGASLPCESEIRERLAAEKIALDAIKSIRLLNEMGEEGILQGYEAWVRVKDCKGHYVFNLSDACYINQFYSRVSCFPGTPRR